MSKEFENLFTKNGLTARKIAKKLIHLKEGERIPRVEDFSKSLSIGRGTVQSGLKVLENMQAIQLESRGHLGTFLTSKDVHLLKEIAGEETFIGAMPLPYSLHYEGLATGLLETSESMSQQINMAYMRGSRRRLEGLKSRRYDFAIMSFLAAEEEIKKDDQLEIVTDFGPESFVTSHQVFFADPDQEHLKDGMRVGIDYSSIDQSMMTQLECEGLDVELVPITYMQVFARLQGGELDAAVWNSDENRVTAAFKKTAFRTEEAKSVAKKAARAVILLEKERTDVQEFFRYLDKMNVIAIQQQIVKKEKLPEY